MASDKAASGKAGGGAGIVPGDHPGSARSLSGGAPPSPEYKIKGNADSMIYHTPDSLSYDRTVAEVWFRTEEEAKAAGFRAPKHSARPAGG